MDIKTILVGAILGLSQLMLGLGIQKPLAGGLGILIEMAVAFASPWLAFSVFPVYALMQLWFGGKETGERGKKQRLIPVCYVIAGVNGPLLGRQFELSESRPVMDFGTQANMIKLPEGTPGVSRHHCMVVLKNGEVYITDLNSSYGTYLWQPYGQGPYANPQRIQPNMKYNLYAQTEFFLGSQHVAFQLVNLKATVPGKELSR